MVWPVWATCTLAGLWCWESGVLAGVDRQGAQGRERQAQLAYPLVICFGRGPEVPEGVRPTAGGMDPQKHSVGCLRDASKLPGRKWFPLGFWLGDGRGRWCWRVPLFPAKLSSVVRGSTTLPPVVLQPSHALSAELLTYNLPDVKSCLLSEHTPSSPSRFCQPDSGALLGRRAAPPLRSLLPVPVARTASPPFLPSSVGLSSTLGESVLLVFWLFSGLFRQV